MSIESPLVHADMVEATEFPELSSRYSVYGVPLTVANDAIRLEGGAPEPYYVPRLLEALGVKDGHSAGEDSDGPYTGNP